MGKNESNSSKENDKINEIDVLILKYEKDNSSVVISNKDEDFYVGFLGENFKRKEEGLNKYKNGDYYYGKWKEDQKDGKGIYYSPNQRTLFIGKWTKDERVEGLYLWGNEKEGQLFNKELFDIFIGKFQNDMYSDGKYYQKLEDDMIVFKGKFELKDNKNLKTDKSEIYLQKTNTYFNGVFEDDIIKTGYLLNFEDKEVKKQINLKQINRPDEKEKETLKKDGLTFINDYSKVNLKEIVSQCEKVAMELASINIRTYDKKMEFNKMFSEIKFKL